MLIGDNESGMQESEIYPILEKSILAPSGDNMQPWRFRVSGNRIDLFIVPGHKGHFFEVGYRTLYLSAGAVIENIRVAAAHAGYRLSLSYFPDEGNDRKVASITLEPVDKSNPRQTSHYAALDRRCTNRVFYDSKKKISQDSYSKIEEMALPEKGYRLIWLKRGDPSYAKLSHLVGQADKIRFENERIHTEFIEKVRFGRESVEKSKDGLDVRTFEASPAGGCLFRLIASWKRLRFLNFLGLSRTLSQHLVKQMRSSQAAGLIVTPSHSPQDYVIGGEVMERIWHEITLQGLAIQPMAGIPVFLINLILEGGSAFSAAQKVKAEEIKQEFLSLFGINDQNGLILLFRIGYAKPPGVRSLRRPLESFLMKGAPR